MKREIAGTLAGIFATIPMTLFMLGGYRLLPKREQYPLPPREIVDSLLEKVDIENNVDETFKIAGTWASHFAYGGAMGLLFATSIRTAITRPIAQGTAFGLGVWSGSYLGMLPALKILESAAKHPARRNALMIVGHVVWGAAFGLIFSRLSNERKSEI